MDNPGLDPMGPLTQKTQLAQPLSPPLSSHAVSRDDISDFTVNASKTIGASDVGEEGELVESMAGDSEEGAGFHESENFSFPWDEENSQILRLSIRAPLSDESHTERFLAIRPDLEAHLAPFKIDHVLTLTIAVISGSEVHWETPVVLLILTKEDDMFDIAGISSIIERGGFNVVVARGRIEFGDERINPTWAKEFHSQLCSGVAIGTPGSNSHGTAGIFIRNGEDTFGVTCGHVAKSSSTIIQPSLPFFTTEYNNLIQRREDIERRLRSPLLEQDRRSLEKTHKEYTERIELLKSYIFSKKELNKTLEAGRVVTSRWEKVEYHGRKCYIDCAVFELNRIRGPVLFRDYPVAASVEQPILSSISWAPCDRLGDIVYDMAVRKLGVTTGQTFGVIAGMHTKIYTKDDIALSEYFVLSESSIMKQTFAKAGDSGSAIISGEGAFVGMYFATIFSDTIELIILQNTEDWPDFRRMAGRRKQDGTVDFEDTFKLAYKGVELALIQDARLLKDLMGLHHYGYVIQDL